MARSPVWQRLLDVAQDQWGLLTRRQAESHGLAWSTLSRLTKSGILEHYAHGVYRLHGAPEPDHLPLRAAWLQLSPSQPAWDRSLESGVVSHRSAAAFYGFGDLPGDVHEFTLPERRQSRRLDVRLHKGQVDGSRATWVRGLPVTRPHRIVADLLADQEEPDAIGYIAADALRSGLEPAEQLASAIAPYAKRHDFRTGDGEALLSWLLELSGAQAKNLPSNNAGK